MGTHTRRAFLNSCIKTPIDPCNNCPAPIYNRPKMYLGHMKTATHTSRTREITESAEVTNSIIWPSTGIRSLAKFYDSIPDYCDINHLTEEEFYSTLDTLRSTCQELKAKPCLLEESSNTSTFSSSTNCKTKKSYKKKNVSAKKGGSKKKTKADKGETKNKVDQVCATSTPCSGFLDNTPIKSSKQDIREEVEAFRKTLKDYEDNLKSRITSKILCRAKSSGFLANLNSPKSKVDENTQTEPESFLLKPDTPNCLKSSIRKSFSSNDIALIDDAEKETIRDFQPTIFRRPLERLTKAETLVFKDKMSNFCFEQTTKTQSPFTRELPKIIVCSPSTEMTNSNTTTERSSTYMKKDKRSKKKPKSQVPFSIFGPDNDSGKKENIETPSPVFPAARPNLAATLRAEVSKKKLKELQNNCTYNDKTPHFDWEVRKTPAWRLLSLNETHEEILALRLATRKAEQALQQREYELNKQLMLSRVKSAPLLLEGNTYWGPNVGKLTHNCQNEGLRHTCDSVKEKLSKKCSVEKGHCSLKSRNKLYDLQKIYGNNGMSSSLSRNSQRSRTSTAQQKRRKEKKRTSSNVESRPPTLLALTQPGSNDSGDDLCSADRAFL